MDNAIHDNTSSDETLTCSLDLAEELSQPGDTLLVACTTDNDKDDDFDEELLTF